MGTQSLTTVITSFFKVGMSSTFSTASPDDEFNSRVSSSKALSAEVSLLASKRHGGGSADRVALNTNQVRATGHSIPSSIQLEVLNPCKWSRCSLASSNNTAPKWLTKQHVCTDIVLRFKVKTNGI